MRIARLPVCLPVLEEATRICHLPKPSKVSWKGFSWKDKWLRTSELEAPSLPPAIKKQELATKEQSSTAIPTKGAKKPNVSRESSKVIGLSALMYGIDESVQAAALKWCHDNNVRKTALIAELNAVEGFIAAMPMNPSGLAANAIRMRFGNGPRSS